MTTSDDIATGLPKRHPNANCYECPLFQNNAGDLVRSRHGSTIRPRLAIVGDAPTYKDVVEGKPFSGPAGGLLNSVLAHYNINIQEAFLTNAVLCHSQDKVPAGALKACAPRLDKELQQARPEKIIALGKTAIEAVVGAKTNVTAVRVGPPVKVERFPDSLVIPTYHPGAALRNTDMFPDIITDFGKIHGPVKVGWEPPVVKIIDDVEDALDFISMMREERLVCLDIEVGVEKDQDFSHPDQLLCVGLSYRPGKAWVLSEGVSNNPSVKHSLGLMLDHHPGIICHNGKFDLQVLRRIGYCNDAEVFFDTMLASYCLDERQGVHGLKHIAAELLGAPAYDLEIKQYISGGESFANIPRDLLYKYNAYDVTLTMDLYEHYVKALNREDLRSLHDMLVEIANHLMCLELEGIKVDADYLDYLTEHYLDELAETEEALSKWVDNPRSPKQVKEALWLLGHRVDSTNEETLQKILGKTSEEFVQLMLHYRKEHKLYGTYVKGIHKRLIGGRAYPTFLLHGTVTGRLACRNPNLQNVPRSSKIRRLFIPEEGNTFIQADYAQAELRVIAALAEDEYLQDIFNADRDLHSEVATRFYGPNFTKDQRVRAKAVVFGLAYGREAYSLAQEYGIPVSEAQRYLDTFFEAIPQVVSWRADLERRVLQNSESLQTRFGRKRRFWLITKENQREVIKEAYNFMPQSIASDLTLLSLVQIRKALPEVKVRLPVHDSILAECPQELAPEAVNEMARIMQQVAVTKFTDYVKFPCDTQLGASWGDLD